MDNPFDCPVCWRRFTTPVVLNCGHTFDRACVASEDHCPLCRAEILTREVNWQLVSVLESGEEWQLESSEEEKRRFTPITDWSTVLPGTMVKYRLKKKIRMGWFIAYNLETVTICHSRGGPVHLPEIYLKDCREISLEKRHAEADCCVVV